MRKLKTMKKFINEFDDFKLEVNLQSTIKGSMGSFYSQDESTAAQGNETNTDCATRYYWDNGHLYWSDITVDEQ